jgi:hypothetical protein
MLSINPAEIISISKCEPPKLMNGKLTPSIGDIPKLARTLNIN